MKILVTGAEGLLGRNIVKELRQRGHNTVGTYHIRESTDPSSLPLDITDRDSVLNLISHVKPDTVIHCAAWTAVDAAEDPQNRSRVHAVNTEGTRNIALACRLTGCSMLYFSTDYVFSGQGNQPWSADCIHFSPVNVYGQTKREGEQAVMELLSKYFILRISWVFGPHGKNFVDTMLRLGKKQEILQVVNDQIGTPTYTQDLARLAADMIETEAYGIYHATNEGEYISWYEFACEIFRQTGYKTSVVPVSTQEYAFSKAKRPFNSRLDKSKLSKSGFQPLPHWQDALSRYLQEIEGIIWEKST